MVWETWTFWGGEFNEEKKGRCKYNVTQKWNDLLLGEPGVRLSTNVCLKWNPHVVFIKVTNFDVRQARVAYLLPRVRDSWRNIRIPLCAVHVVLDWEFVIRYCDVNRSIFFRLIRIVHNLSVSFFSSKFLNQQKKCLLKKHHQQDLEG